jgi:hypothetical protein
MSKKEKYIRILDNNKVNNTKFYDPLGIASLNKQVIRKQTGYIIGLHIVSYHHIINSCRKY